MDGVIADFVFAIKEICPELETSDNFPDYETRSKKVDEIVENNLDIFHNLHPIEGAVDAVNKLFEIYDVYFFILTYVGNSRKFRWQKVMGRKIFW